MTREEFDALRFGADMRVKHTTHSFNAGKAIIEEYDVVSVNFNERTIGVRSYSDECSNCGEEIAVIDWLSYENCEIIKK